MTDLDLFAQWLEKLKSRNASQKQFGLKKNSASSVGKRYSHFDHPIAIVKVADYQDWLLDTKRVGQHAFYPFIKIILSKRRYLTDKATGDRKKHPEGPKERDICYAAHHDSLLFSWYAHKIDELVEKKIQQLNLSDSVLAYRSLKRNNVAFAKEVFDFISTKTSCVALAFDVSKFFPTLDHKHLKQVWANLLGLKVLPEDHYTIFKAMTRFRFIEMTMIQAHLSREKLKECKKLERYFGPEDFRKYLAPLQETNLERYGIPQGSPLSAVLSNLYMLSLDERLAEFAVANKGLYRRYCDDLLLVLPQECADAAEQLVETEFSRLKLVMNKEKTERRFFSIAEAGDKSRCVDEKNKPTSLQYLGLEYDGCAVRIRPASLVRYHQRIKKGVQKAVSKALSKGSAAKKPGQVFKRTLYEKYTHLGRSNFISYVHAAYRHTNSVVIKRQVRGSVQQVNLYLKIELERRMPGWEVRRNIAARKTAEHQREISPLPERVKRMDFNKL